MRNCLVGVLALLTLTVTAAEDLSKQHARSAPEWLRNGVVYEIFPRNFSPEGNFNGITARLDELKSLGVDILWLMPIHPIGEKMRKGRLGSRYAVRDFFAIHPHYGTEADLKRLVSEAHKSGLKVIIDIVANHTAWDSVMMEHPAFYKQDAHGRIVPPVPEWSDVAGLKIDSIELSNIAIAEPSEAALLATGAVLALVLHGSTFGPRIRCESTAHYRNHSCIWSGFTRLLLEGQTTQIYPLAPSGIPMRAVWRMSSHSFGFRPLKSTISP